MLFNSVDYALFFPAIFLVYWVLPRRAQNGLLLAASYFFYGCWDWRFCSLIALSTLIDFVCGIRIERASDREKRKWLWLSAGFNLGVLAVFKYLDFFADSAAGLLEALGFHVSHQALGIILPVGLSFYTFQTMSYTIDVYRGRLPATRDLLDFSLFVAFFPQLVAGPIERASAMLPQFQRGRVFQWDKLYSGCYLILWGLFKKIFIADNLAPIVDSVYSDPGSAGILRVILATYAFAVQIYCDFSGYTDIARGCARCLGFELSLNFNLPYFATTPSEFWRRWHISLSSWLREYLYVSLGGNRRGLRRTYANLFMTMLLGGLWHGAAWHFVAWGAYHGLLLIGQRLLGLQPRDPDESPEGIKHLVSRLPGMVIMFQFTCLGWLLFRVEDLDQIGTMLTLRTSDAGQAWSDLKWIFFYASPLLLMQVVQFVQGRLDVIWRWPVFPRALWYTACVYALLLFGKLGAREFIYFQF